MAAVISIISAISIALAAARLAAILIALMSHAHRSHTEGIEPTDLVPLLERVSSLHTHLCPRQVLGVRIGLLGAACLGVSVPQSDKRLLAFVETDGCFADGVSVATGCWLGHRTLSLIDCGKAAATLVDTESGRAVRVRPQPHARDQALMYAPDAPDKWTAQLKAYQLMADRDLLEARPVTLTLDIEAMVSRPGLRVPCAECGEEIMNEREVLRGGVAFCKVCAGVATYYREP
jgi:formylmethanofuran dehydrogenase subunit E